MNEGKEPIPMGGNKFDAGKPPLELIPWAAVNAAYGAIEETCEDPAGVCDGVTDYLSGGGLACLFQSAEDLRHHLTVELVGCGDWQESWPAMLEEARVLAFGAQKYGRDNWRKGLAQTRVLGAALRHFAAWRMGERNDPETGLHHLAHALCEVHFAITYALEGRCDDRYGYEHPEANLDGCMVVRAAGSIPTGSFVVLDTPTEPPASDVDLASLEAEAEATAQLIRPVIPPQAKVPAEFPPYRDGMYWYEVGDIYGMFDAEGDLCFFTIGGGYRGYLCDSSMSLSTGAQEFGIDLDRAIRMYHAIKSAETSTAP